MGLAATAIFELIEAWPRFKDTALDPMRGDGGPGALLLRGPSKLLQTLAKVTQASKAATTADRFKPLLSRSAVQLYLARMLCARTV